MDSTELARATKEKLKLILLEELELVTKMKNQMLQKVAKQYYNDTRGDISVVPASSFHWDQSCLRNNEEFTVHVNQFMAANIIVNGIDFSLEKTQRMSDGSKAFAVDANAGHVKFYITFTWNESQKKQSDINVHFVEPFYQCELASSLNMCIRSNNLHQLIKMIRSYSELSLKRETVLRHLRSNYEHLISYHKLETEGCYQMEIKDSDTGDRFLEATWSIVWYKARNCMDNVFNVSVSQEAQDVAKEQKALFIQLTSKEDMSDQTLIGIFTAMLQAWQDRLG